MTTNKVTEVEVNELETLHINVRFVAVRRQYKGRLNVCWHVNAYVGEAAIWSKAFSNKGKLCEFMDSLKLAQSMGRVQALLGDAP
jgi:hypothetical protein